MKFAVIQNKYHFITFTVALFSFERETIITPLFRKLTKKKKTQHRHQRISGRLEMSKDIVSV